LEGRLPIFYKVGNEDGKRERGERTPKGNENSSRNVKEGQISTLRRGGALFGQTNSAWLVWEREGGEREGRGGITQRKKKTTGMGGKKIKHNSSPKTAGRKRLSQARKNHSTT